MAAPFGAITEEEYQAQQKPDIGPFGAIPEEDYETSLRDDPNFNPAVYAAQNPLDFDLAYKVQKAKEARPLGVKVKEAVSDPWGTLTGAASGVGNFLRGIFYQTPKDITQQAYYSATGQDEKALTKQAEATLSAQGAEESAKHLVDATVGNAAMSIAKLEDPYPARTAWRASFLRRHPEARAKYEKLWAEEDAKDKSARNEDLDRQRFQEKVSAAQNALQLQSGRPLEHGPTAGIYHLGGQSPGGQVGPEALQAAGAQPVDPAAVAAKTAAVDPSLLALSVAPQLPGAAWLGGRVTQGVGKALQLPMRALEEVPGHMGKTATAATATGAGVALGETALHNPLLAGKIAASVAGAKGLQKLGQVMETQGREMATGAPSELTTRAATARLEKARGLGGLDLKAELGRKIGSAPAHAASTVAGMTPLNLALSEGDPKAFAELEAGAGAFGTALGALHSTRPMLVEGLRPYLRSEGARMLQEDGSELARKSAEYLMSQPDEVRDRAFEIMGALQGTPTKAGDSTNQSKYYILDEETYQGIARNVAMYGVPKPSELDPNLSKRARKEARKVYHKAATSDGGRGFVVDTEGTAYINGGAQGGPGDLAHTMGHEGTHLAKTILRAAGSQGSAFWDSMMDSVSRGLIRNGEPTEDFIRFVKQYNQSRGPRRFDPYNPQAVEEFLAEHAGRILAGEGVDFALPKGLADHLNDGLARFASIFTGTDKIGQTSHLNAVEQASVTKLMRETLAQIAQMPRSESPRRRTDGW